MFTAKIVSIGKQKSNVFDLLVEFSKDGIFYSNRVFENVPDESSIKGLIQRELQQIKKIDSIKVNDLIGNYDLTPDPVPQPPVVIPPTPDEVALAAYSKSRSELQIMKQDLELGLVDKSTYDAAVQVTLALKP